MYLPKDRIQWENPYFDDYPKHLLSIPENLELFDYKYHITDSKGGTYQYTLNYEANITPEDFMEYYESHYGGEENFEILEDGTIRWEKEGYAISVTYVDDHKRAYMSVSKYVLN